ncbi:MAG TPA: GNAT family N-acetyltransferase [Candidatus Rothia avistercoris]|uniref:GNAT family N-acetyltransferase n=1 Tax=Candidatus Rothia avistercoris TaxID=2840479 RepID=A0A9D2UGQ4_9MICC|nr:GNAT family N-acetyltransferase [Candidatus Rothia avistercoris]
MQLTMIFEGSKPASAHTLPGQIRPFTTNEVPVLAQLYFDSYPQGTVEDVAEAEADISAALRGDYGTFLPQANLVYVVDGQILGCVMTVDSPPWDDVSDLFFIIDVFVHTKVRGTGVGRALMQAALSNLPEHRPVGLRVESDNEPAYALYRSLGFKEVTADK